MELFLFFYLLLVISISGITEAVLIFYIHPDIEFYSAFGAFGYMLSFDSLESELCAAFGAFLIDIIPVSDAFGFLFNMRHHLASYSQIPFIFESSFVCVS